MSAFSSPSVSALGSVYWSSSPAELRIAVDSLFLGCSTPLEVVLVVDGPVPHELRQAIDYVAGLECTKIVNISCNVGLGLALSSGLQCASGQIIVRFDTDDVNLPGRVNALVQAFRECPDVDIIGSSLYEFSSAPGPALLARIKKVPLFHDEIVRYMNFLNPINHPSVAFRTNALRRIGAYEDCKLFEDYFLWLKCKKHGLRFLNLSAPLLCMRRASLFDRRSGFFYFLCEFRFALKALNAGYISSFVAVLFFVRAFGRLVIPKFFLRILVTRRRGEWVDIANPDMLFSSASARASRL